jgi:glutathione S-transferase
MRLYDCSASANGYKVRLALAQLDLPCAVVEVDIFAGESRTPAFLARNPAGRVPVLELPSGQTLPESNAIVWYLADGSPLLPDGRWERAQVVRWLSFEQYEVEPVIGSARFWKLTGRDVGRAAELEAKLLHGTRTLAGLDAALRERPFLVGERYTIADLVLFAYTHVAPEAGLDLAPFPSLRRWIERVRATPRFVDGPAPYPANVRV